MSKNITIDFLITVVGLTTQQILDLVQETKFKGNIIVGNQKMSFDSEETFILGDSTIKIFNMTSQGVSLNRNFLLSKSTSDYVIFCDYDVQLNKCDYRYLVDKIKTTSSDKIEAIRFNYDTLNYHRKPKILKTGFKKWFHLKSMGCNCIFFKRDFLLKNNITFDENIGPGGKNNKIVCGEDSLFLHTFFKKNGRLFQIYDSAFIIKQLDSTWLYSSKTTSYYFTQGFLSFRLYGYLHFLKLFKMLIKGNKHFKLKMSSKIKEYFLGVRFAKISFKNKLK